MKIVGIIGPYISGGNRRLIDHNIANAQYVSIQIANFFKKNKLVGFFCPHSHTARFERLAEASEPYYHALDDALYDRACDSFVLLPGWEKSQGAQRDFKRANARIKAIFYLKSYDQVDMDYLLVRLERWAT